MIKITSFLIFLLLTIVCCRDQITESSIYPKLMIKTGRICGWCTVNDTLTIKPYTFEYVNYINCRTDKPTVKKNGSISQSELDSLVNTLDFSEFKKLNLNSNNVGFDGCDDWILFDNGEDAHYIRFGKEDPKLQSIKTFVDCLDKLKIKYSQTY